MGWKLRRAPWDLASSFSIVYLGAVPGFPSRFDLPPADVIVVGSGPNGLSAAIRVAQAGHSVLLLEGADQAGGGVRSSESTVPGFIHDVCSSVYPLTLCSPFLRSLPLHAHGLEWVFPTVALAHPFDDGSAVVLNPSIEETAASLGVDGQNYRTLVEAFTGRWKDVFDDILAPLHFPHHPVLYGRFGLNAIRSAAGFAQAKFTTEHGRAFFAGLAAHAMLPLEALSTAGVGLMLALSAHGVGWPFARGGAQELTRSLLSLFRSLGGDIYTNHRVESLDQLPPARAILFDVTPRQFLQIAGDRLPDRYRRKLSRYVYGMGAFKIDWALSEPVPWRALECSQAGTIHLGGSLEEICRSEREAWSGIASARPYVLFSQPSIFDSRRAPSGKHVGWAYCHVPHGFAGNVVENIEQQIERFAPGFRDCIQARSVRRPLDLEQYNPNMIGGDIAGGASNLSQLFLRPTASLYRTALKSVYLCSSSTPPGAGVHGMCGYFAAEQALRDLR